MSDDGIRMAPVGKRWVRKTAIFVVVLIGFGSWGLWDAVSVYPKRGERFATWARMSYLDSARNANSEDFGIFEREASVPNPQEEYARLSAPDQRQRNAADAANTGSNRRFRAMMLNARLAWLEGLKRIGELKPERTIIENPRAELERLQAELASGGNPKSLSAYDIPTQWAILIVCWSIAGVILVRAARVAMTKYRWDPATMTLTLPGGDAITPDDIEEVDKRKWDKFIVFLKIKAGHASLGGKEVRFDTYQHDELEDWILAMERAAFGPQEDDAEAEPGVSDEPDPSE